MATTYTAKQLSGAGAPIEALISGSLYNFRLLRPLSLSGSCYFTMETVRDAQGFYDSTRPTNAIGTYDFTAEPDSVVGAVSSSYIMSGVVAPTSDFTSSFAFTPNANIAAGSSLLRGTGDLKLVLENNEHYSFENKAELIIAVNLWTGTPAERESALATYGEINTWLTTDVTDMRELFAAKSTFNSDISNWDVSNVDTFYHMFNGATAYNQPMNNWNVEKVRNMQSMFASAFAFQQPLNLWNLNDLITASFFMGQTDGPSGLTYTEYDALLNGWVVDFAALQNGVTISFGDSKFTSAGQAARNILVNDKGWNITDGGLA